MSIVYTIKIGLVYLTGIIFDLFSHFFHYSDGIIYYSAFGCPLYELIRGDDYSVEYINSDTEFIYITTPTASSYKVKVSTVRCTVLLTYTLITYIYTLCMYTTLDHLTFRTFYLSRIALELSFRAPHIYRERTTRKIESISNLCFVLICIQTPIFVIIWLHFDFSDCLLLAKSLIIKCSEI